jgi:hypothetical protein
MILDSVVWKEELGKKIIEFREILSAESVLDDEIFDYKVEEFFFVTAFIVRKLVESNKLSDEYRGIQYKLIKYLRIDNEYEIDSLNKYEIEKHYNLDSPQNTSLSLHKVYNSLIHSYIFLLEVKDNSLNGLFVTTDYDKEKFILYLTMYDYINLLEGCINDNIVRFVHNRITGYTVKSSNYD